MGEIQEILSVYGCQIVKNIGIENYIIKGKKGSEAKTILVELLDQYKHLNIPETWKKPLTFIKSKKIYETHNLSPTEQIF